MVSSGKTRKTLKSFEKLTKIIQNQKLGRRTSRVLSATLDFDPDFTTRSLFSANVGVHFVSFHIWVVDELKAFEGESHDAI